MIQLPEWAEPLFQPARYKVAHGGRGSSKSWSFAMALLLRGVQKSTRIICAREVQKSIKESVHRLLSDQIQMMGLGQFYDVLENEIRGRNGTTFSFSGLATHTVESIKSFEGADICWIEEAQSVSKRSWDVLTPTIRRPGSEIWLTLNPLLDTDETWTRFVLEPPPNSWVREVNYTDNPWFSDELEQERLHCLRTRPDDYDNIWLGKCKAAVEGAIYAREIEVAQLDGRITFVPHDPKLKTHIVFDLGWNDSMVVAFVQRHLSSIRIIDCIKDSHRVLDSYAKEILDRNYRVGRVFLPHDGYHKDFKTGKSAAEILARHFRQSGQIKPVPKMSIEAGIQAARASLAQTAFDKTKAADIVNSLKRYRRTIHTATQEPGAPLHDDASHGADVYRYVALCAEQMHNEDDRALPAMQGFEPFDATMGY